MPKRLATEKKENKTKAGLSLGAFALRIHHHFLLATNPPFASYAFASAASLASVATLFLHPNPKTKIQQNYTSILQKCFGSEVQTLEYPKIKDIK